MKRLIHIHGPQAVVQTVCEIGQEGAIDFQDWGWGEEGGKKYALLLARYDDEQYGQAEVFDQVRTLLTQHGLDPDEFRVADRSLAFPDCADAVDPDWYTKSHALGDRLLDLEALGVRTEGQQQEHDELRECIRYRVAMVSEQADAAMQAGTDRISALLGIAQVGDAHPWDIEHEDDCKGCRPLPAVTDPISGEHFPQYPES